MNQECETYRSVKDSFWTDPMILDLLPEEKLFYLWLFTNRSVQICGCYQVSVRTIEYELNLSRDSVLQLISNFIELGRIRYSEVNKEIILLKWFKHNSGFFKVGNKNTRKAINIGVNQIKTEDFKDIVLGWMDNEEAPTPDNGKKEQALCKPLASPLPDKDKKEQAPCKPLTYNNNNNNNSNNNKEPSSSPDVKLTTELEQTADETAV
ncbi:hypothetical protein UFOVP1419_1, partial [uncultured Caudovirales phage]